MFTYAGMIMEIYKCFTNLLTYLMSVVILMMSSKCAIVSLL